ncbi:MAG TPA: hypothetical protein DCG63_06570 [Methylophilaceae bacterium]|nr:hypothetical protein [Methylophilaceae bacterium]
MWGVNSAAYCAEGRSWEGFVSLVTFSYGAMPFSYCALRELDRGDYLKLLPHVHGTDGFFAAVFEKNPDNRNSQSALLLAS